MIMTKMMTRRPKVRTRKGLMTSTLFVFLILALFIGVFIVCDVCRAIVIEGQLKRGTDSAALSGARLLAKPVLVAGTDDTNAAYMAKSIAALNEAEREKISSLSADTEVNASADAATRVVKVGAVRDMKLITAQFLGHAKVPISTLSMAEARKGLLTITPGQARPLGLSLDTIPTAGPQAGRALSSFVIGDRYEINVSSVSAQQNGAWVDTATPSWTVLNPSTLRIGDDLTVAGTPDDTIKVGEKVLFPIIKGGAVPFSGNKPLVGVLSMKITARTPATGHPEKVTGMITAAIGLQGKPGTPTIAGLTPAESSFLSSFAPWKVMLKQ